MPRRSAAAVVGGHLIERGHWQGIGADLGLLCVRYYVADFTDMVRVLRIQGHPLRQVLWLTSNRVRLPPSAQSSREISLMIGLRGSPMV